MEKTVILIVVFFKVSVCVKFCTKYGDDCPEEFCQRSIPCYHGNCDVMGHCICEACYQGDSCDIYEDKHPPLFTHPNDVVYIDQRKLLEAVYRAKAIDEDFVSTCGRNSTKCDCSTIRYYLFDIKNYFTINSITGEVFIKDPNGLLSVDVYTIYIKAKGVNYDEKHNSSIEVKFYVKTGITSNKTREIHKNVSSNARYTPLRREKRQDQSGSGNYFELKKKDGDETKLKVGEMVSFELIATVPTVSGLDVTAEIFTKQVCNDSYVPTLAICGVAVTTASSSITYSTGEPRVKTIWNDITVADRVIVEFGEITNKGPESQIVVEFFVTPVANPDTTYEVEHYVTTGAEFNKENYVWLSQHSVTPNKSPEDSPGIKVIVDGSTDINVDKGNVYTIDATIVSRSTVVTVIVWVDNDRVLSIGHLGVKEFGEYFDCIPRDIYYYNATYESDNKTCLNTEARLRLGVITNTGPPDEEQVDDNRKITFTFSIYAVNDTNNVGKEVGINAGILLDETKVWSSIINVTIKEREEDAPIIYPKDVEISESEDRDVSPGSLVSILNYMYVEDLGGYFNCRIKVVVPKEDDKEQLEPCAARFVRADYTFNIPYVPCDVDVPSENIEEKTYLFTLHRIYIVDQRNPGKYNDSLVLVEIVMKVATHDKSTSGTKLKPDILVETANGFESFSVGNLVIKGPADPPVPSVVVDNAVSWDTLYDEGAIAFLVKVSVSAGISYGDLVFEGAADENSILKICTSEVLEVGPHLPCTRAHIDDINQNATYSLINPSEAACLKSNRVVLKLGDVGAINREEEDEKNRFIIKVVASIPECSEPVDETKYELAIGLTIGSKSMWASEIKYTFSGEDIVIKEDKEPIITVKPLTETIAAGYPLQILININSAPDSIGRFVIKVTALTETSNVCVLRINGTGKHLPCVDPETPAKYQPYEDDRKGVRRAIIELKALSNTGSPDSDQSSFDNELQVIAIVLVSQDATDDQKLQWEVDYGIDKKSDELIIPVDETAIPEMCEDEKTLNLTLNPGNEVAVDAPMFVILDIELPEFCAADLHVTIINPDHENRKFRVCSAGVAYFGANYPCFKPETLKTISPCEDCGPDEVALISLRTVCNSYIDRENNSANLIQLKAAIYPTDYIEKDEINIKVKFNIGQRTIDDLPVLNAKFIEEKSYDAPDNIEVELLEESIPIRVREKTLVPFKIKIEPNYIQKITIRVKSPISDGRPIFVFHGLHFASAGRNIPCSNIREDYALSSEAPTCQNNTIEADIGYLGNTDIILTDKIEEDDRVNFNISVELTDHVTAEHESEQKISISVTINGESNELEQTFLVERDGKETANLMVDVAKSGGDCGDNIVLKVSVQHSNESRAEPIEVVVDLHTPPFLILDSVTSWNVKEQPTFNNQSGGIRISFGSLAFCEVARVEFTVKVDCFQKSSACGNNVTAPYRVLCRQTLRSTPVQNPQEDKLFYCAEMSHLHYEICCPECGEKLGIDDPTVVDDCQLTASAAASKDYAAHFARIIGQGEDSGKVWAPPVRSGFCNDYLQIDFLRTVRVVKVVLQKIQGMRYVTEFKLLCGMTGVDWTLAVQATTNFRENLSETRLVKPVTCRFFQLVILQNNDPDDLSNYIGVRMELYGCPVDKAKGAECNSDSTWYSDDPANTGRHLVGGCKDEEMYFCDTCTNHPSGNKCYYTLDDGKRWNVVQRNIGKVVGCDKETGITYAADKRNWSYIGLKNGTWILVKESDFKDIETKSTFEKPKVIPGLCQEQLGEIAVGEWTVDVYGLRKDGVELTKWDSCCLDELKMWMML
ncbi:uncharacterized protein LOC111614573 [Centruroides sculpturatus]|uniref:uncharacterized protein LOC111614573 n=1 Tax=Centruroides sculpturatus TaxID=218467 RepID=UPI000C6E1C3F|nr:uncharacterized protein LOC111614573 [Centruroides sculpturatus]